MTGADIYMKTCKEKALEWNVSPRSVNDMCKKARKIWLRKQKLNHYQSASLTMFVRRKNITMSTRRY